MKRSIWLCILAGMLLLGTILAGCAAPAATTQPAQTATQATASTEPIKIRFSVYAPELSPVVYAMAKPWKEAIEKRTNGKVQVSLFTGGSLTTMLDGYEQCQKGVCDIFQYAPNPRFYFADMIQLPCQFGSAEESAAVNMEMSEKYFRAVDYPDMKILSMWTTPPNFVISLSDKIGHGISTVSDMKGLRTPSTGSQTYDEAFKYLGFVGVPLPPNAYYESFEKGILDMGINNPDVLVTFKYYMVTKYRTLMPAGLFAYSMGFLMNQKKFDSLPADIQQIINEESGMKLSQSCAKAMLQADINSWAKVKDFDTKAGNPAYTYMTQDAYNEMKAATVPVDEWWIAQREAKGLPAKKAYNDMLDLIKKYRAQYPITFKP